MIKSLFLKVFCFCVASSLFAEVHPSNSIGQIRSTSDDGYYLNVINDRESILTHSGKVVKRYITTVADKVTTKEEIDPNGKIDTYKYDENGNLVEHIDEDGNREINLYDSSLHLISSTTTDKEGNTKSQKVFYRSPQSGAVLGIKNNDTYSFFQDLDDRTLYLQGSDEKFATYETFFGRVTFKTDSNSKEKYTVTHDNDNLIIKTDNNTTIYSKDGLILEDAGVKYTYKEDNTLDYTVEQKGSVLIKEYYKDAIRTIREESNEKGMLKRTIYRSDEIDTELFEGGKKYAVVTYDGDGMKVLRVRYV